MGKHLLTIVALLSAFGMSARHLTPDEALARVQTAQPMGVGTAITKTPRLVCSAKAADIERVYVYAAADKGFMVLSADDCVPALLAYSDTETIDGADLPDNLQYWLDEYARQIAFAAEQGVTLLDEEVTPRAEVAPKLTTKWDQIMPYNNMTPMHNGLPTPTGCVATAVAQIMKYHEWPVRGDGIKTFQSYYLGTLGMDFGAYEFEWDLMPDQLTSFSSAEETDAVAYLMKAAGYAAEMVYHQKASGATGYHAAEGLMTNLGYSKDISLERHEWYDYEQWEDLVYNELTANGPVYFEGEGSGGGHAFVCDGYQAATGLFHFNWGWSGRGDGYYRLSALTPDYAGTGGSLYGYNYQQDIFVGLRPAKEGEKVETPLWFAPGKGVITPWTECELGQPITIKGYETSDGFVNRSVVPVPEVEFGIRLHNVNTGEEIRFLSQNEMYDFDHYTKVNIIRFALPTDLADGEYSLWPIWRTNRKEWREMRYSPMTRNFVPVTVKEGKAELGLAEAEGRAEVKLTHAPEYFTTAGEFTIKGTISSVGTRGFTGLFCAVFFRFDASGNPQIIDQGESERYDLAAGLTDEFTYTSVPQAGKLTDGDDYYIAIGNANTGEILSPLYAVKVGNRYGKLEMSCSNFTIKNSNYLDPAHVDMSVQIDVVAGTYEAPLAIGYYAKKTAAAPVRYTIGKENVFLTAGDSKAVTITGILDDVEEGEIYYAHVMYQSPSTGEWTKLSLAPVTLVVAKSFSGVENVTVAGEATYYDLMGRPVALPAAGGMYIRRDALGNTAKVIK